MGDGLLALMLRTPAGSGAAQSATREKASAHERLTCRSESPFLLCHLALTGLAWVRFVPAIMSLPTFGSWLRGAGHRSKPHQVGATTRRPEASKPCGAA